MLVITEGLVVYLSDQEAVSLAEDLAGTPTFHRWALDMVSPALMQRMQKSSGLKNLEQAGAPLKFAPEEGPAFFERHGWTLVDVQSMLHTAARLKRLSFGMRLIALLPDSKGRTPRSLWGGVCLFERTGKVRLTSITDSWASDSTRRKAMPGEAGPRRISTSAESSHTPDYNSPPPAWRPTHRNCGFTLVKSLLSRIHLVEA